MKVKVIASVLAGVMSVQNVAIAASRVDGIGATQIAAARSEIEILKSSLAQVESSLVDARTEVVTALENKKAPMARVMNYVHVGSATIGLALGAFGAYVSTDPRGRGAAMAVLTYLGGTLAGVSAATGFITDGTTNIPTAAEAQTQLAEGITQIKALSAVSQDPEIKGKLSELEASLVKVSTSLGEFTADKKSDKQFKVGHEIAQSLSVALAVTVMFGHNNMRNSTQEAVMMAAIVTQTVGNLMAVFGSSYEEGFESILEKIDSNLALVRMQQDKLK